MYYDDELIRQIEEHEGKKTWCLMIIHWIKYYKKLKE